MNNRLKEARKTLSLSQEEFGRRIGVTGSQISRLESGAQAITDQMLLAICREYNVDKEWLRGGEGEMFNKPQTFSLDEYAKANGLSALELDIIKTYMELPAKTRQAALSVLRQMFGRTAEEAAIEIEGEAYKEELRAESFTQTASASPKQKDA